VIPISGDEHPSYLRALVDESLHSAAAATTEIAAWSLLDFAACVVAGRPRLPSAWPLTEAGRLAAAAHVEDRDDIHWDSLTHPGGVVWPAVLAVAADVRADGRSIVLAAATGYEVMTRLAAVLTGTHRRYWHTTTSCGAAAAAAAAAVLLGDAETTVDALGHATSVAGGSSRSLFERSGTRLFHRAQVVEAGISAARAAASGIGGTRFGLEHESGVFAALRAEGAPSLGLAPSAAPSMEGASPRLLSATGWAHAACHAALALGPSPVESLDRVTVAVAPAGALLAGNGRPETDEEAWWSIPLAVARVLLSGDERSLDSGLGDDSVVRGLAAEIAVEGTQADVSAVVSVQRRGDGVQSVHAWPLGHPNNPAGPEQRLAKWERLTRSDADAAFASIASCLEHDDPADRLQSLLTIGS
jgi:2-methylcitrate dehydratase PrpD